MGNIKSFFTDKKRIALIIAAVVILALLIVAVSTGAVHKEVKCAACAGVGNHGVECSTCEGTTKVDDYKCADCEGTGFELCGVCGGSGYGQGSLWALLPAIIAIGLALITKEVFSSLFIGIASGAILAADFGFTGTVDYVVNDGLISAVSGSAGIFVFLIELGILVSLINKSGGSRAFGDWAETHVKTKIGATICTFVLGVLIFIDDYFNCLTVGSVMKSVTDKHKISRSKLAYLIDATAAPICMIAPISSWAAAVSQYAADGQGLNLFIMAIPFNFYSLLTFVFIITLTLMKFDFGPMKRHERNAVNGDLTSGAKVESINYETNSNGRVFDLIVPIAILIISCVFALIYNGGFLDAEGSYYLDFVGSFSQTDSTVGLPWGGIVSLILTIVYFAIRRVTSFKDSMKSITNGFIAMVPAILILTLATALKNITGILGAKFFVGDLMNNAAAGLDNFLPAIIFIVACVLSFATGTSWGTFGILIPIVTAMFPEGNSNPLLIISMSACLAGAVCGDHCSPISDTTIMSSAGAECEHINHVSTQLPYAITVAAISFVMFIFAGFVQNAWISLIVGAAITVGTLFVIKKMTSKDERKVEQQVK